MTWPAPWIFAAAVLAAAALVLVPRPLFAEVGEAPPRRRQEVLLALGLAVLGVAAAIALPGESLARAAWALVAMALAAVIYADLRFYIIPDVYSLIVALIALFSPISPGWLSALAGAAICGGLLAGVAWAFKRATEVEGMGFGDVKLGAALGALFGPEQGLWLIAGSAIAAAAVGLVLKRLRGDTAPLLIPYGAVLALGGVCLIAGTRL
jgi:leader peptidase (prepilin peptidase)/N-methyltransferase